ncbi:hypothetical protein G5B38_02345 [Pseudohalocynthiibacter aestuariivivens]|nr:hypothetical protein [Pseudohalocynthiibacter aestuariivivens]QIE44458.1 hypothetical protein G5B38_02345 [Pseudohalocynthiibacter aestuariivivens]
MGSKSSSSAATSSTDGRVAGDNGAIGVSAQGDVALNIVPDEAFELGGDAIMYVSQIAELALEGGQDNARIVADVVGGALSEAQAAQRTEAANLSETIVKLGIPAVAVAYVVGRMIK